MCAIRSAESVIALCVLFNTRVNLTTLLFVVVNVPVNFPPVGIASARTHNELMIRTQEFHIARLTSYKLKKG